LPSSRNAKGYGDLYPQTVPVVAMALTLLGIGFLAVLTAMVAGHFVKADTTEESQEILQAPKRVSRSCRV
jgi:hypothetical protein